jgi:hypothetical protein
LCAVLLPQTQIFTAAVDMESEYTDDDEDEDELFAEVTVVTRADALEAIEDLDQEFHEYVEQHGHYPTLNFVRTSPDPTSAVACRVPATNPNPNPNPNVGRRWFRRWPGR